MSSSPAATSPNGYGSIRSDEIMPLREAARRLGWGQRAVRHALRAGLATTKFGRLRYVRGRALVEFFAALEAAQYD